MSEEWRDISGYEGAYQVSDLGRVRGPRGRILRAGIASHGYPTVCLGRGNTRTVHSLVARAFLGPTPEGHEIRHKDGARTNAALANLHFGTRTENILDAVRQGTWMTPKRLAHMRRMTEARLAGIAY